jgi:hypothetical protein
VQDVVAKLDGLLRDGRYEELEAASRQQLAERRFYVWHLYLVVSLLRRGRRDDAAKELDEIFSYKFNIGDRAWPEVKEAFPEKFEGHFILSTMKPETGFESGARVRKHWRIPFPIAQADAYRAAAAEIFADSVAPLPPLDAAATRVATFGSCFAANLARHLKGAGVDATNLLIEESINSPLANQAFLAAITGSGEAAQSARLGEVFGTDFLARAREQLAQAQVIVLTLGVAPNLFHVDTHRFALLEDYRALLAAGKLYMKTPGVEEVKAVIGDVLKMLRGLNPRSRIYVSISPVPLMGTAELANAVLADCVSKSTLRAALHELLQASGASDSIYWPSFEVVRWLGAHTTLSAYGIDDQVSRHVSEWLVTMIVEEFRAHLFGGATNAAAAKARTLRPY